MMDADETVPHGEFVALARDEGLIALDVQVIQAPGEGNGYTAVVQVTARTGEASFGAVGEASPRSAPEDWHPFLTTLAELRAKARALREITGLEHVMAEEMDAPYLAAQIPVERVMPPRPQPVAGTNRARPAAPSAADTRSGAATPSRADVSAAPAVQQAAAALEKFQQRASSRAPSAGARDAGDGEADDEATAPQPTATGTATAAPSPAVTAPATAAPSPAATAPAKSAPSPAAVAETATARSQAAAARPGASSAPATDDAPVSSQLAASPSPPTPAAPPPDDEPEPGFEGLSRDMETKLLRLAMSIAQLEGDDPSEAEARQRLDDFFVRKFKHPLNRASRIEGQGVVQRLSAELTRLRQKSSQDAD